MPAPPLRVSAVVPMFLGLCLLALLIASPAEAAKKSKDVPGELRVVDSNGDALAQQTQYTGSVSIKSDPKADCFGEGTGGSGDKVAVPGSTALGMVQDGITADRDLKPVSISDSFDFGVALCGIGDAVSPSTGFWYLKQNHVGSQLGGDQTDVKKGDDILWYLIEDFNQPTPDELALSAPKHPQSGQPFTVKVVSYADDGTKTPAVGASVSGAALPTGPDGTTEVTSEAKLVKLIATREGAIPSNEKVLCTAGAACRAGYARTIGGTKGDDRIAGGSEAEKILAGGGDDRIVASSGKGDDVVKCGGGRDKLILAKGQKVKASSCERIVHRKG
jgi:hypothetical protein